jgi:integrase
MCLLFRNGGYGMATGKIQKRTVDAAMPGDKDFFLWDNALKGFGLKVTPAGRKVYLVQYRTGGRSGKTRRVTIGVHGSPFTAEGARSEAEKILSAVKLGEDVAEKKTLRNHEYTVSLLADRYIAEHVQIYNKPSTEKEATRIVEKRIKPAFGNLKITDLTKSRVKTWYLSMKETPYEANRAMAYLSKMISLAINEWELISRNVCIGIKKYREEKRERFLSEDELGKIGRALRKIENENAAPMGCINAIRLLALTGMRLSEILSLKWDYVNLADGVIELPDAKAGARIVPIGASGQVFLQNLTSDGYVVKGPSSPKPLSTNTLHKFWNTVGVTAEIPDARLHDFRHTAGTYAAQAGFNAFIVRDLLGHKTMDMAGRYAERSTDPMRKAADSVAGRISAAMDDA